MMLRKIFALTLLVLVAAFGSMSVSAQSAPPNDNTAFARLIAPDSKTKVKNAHLATSQVGEMEPSCSGAIYHTVWFQITAPAFTTVLLNTDKSRLPNTPSIDDTVIALYSVSNGFLTEVQCVDLVSYVTNTAYMTASLNPNTTYYIQVGSPYIHTSGTWQYMLTSRVLYAEYPLANGDFEAPLSNADWKVKHGTNDRRECNNGAYPAWEGDCAFVLAGSVGEKTTLNQKFTPPSGYKYRKGAAIAGAIMVRDAGVNVEDAKLTLTVTYSDGKPATKATVSIMSTNTGYNGVGVYVHLTSKKVKHFKLTIKNKATSGEMIIDRVAIGYLSSVTRDTLALPPAPQQ